MSVGRIGIGNEVKILLMKVHPRSQLDRKKTFEEKATA